MSRVAKDHKEKINLNSNNIKQMLKLYSASFRTNLEPI